MVNVSTRFGKLTKAIRGDDFKVGNSKPHAQNRQLIELFRASLAVKEGPWARGPENFVFDAAAKKLINQFP